MTNKLQISMGINVLLLCLCLTYAYGYYQLRTIVRTDMAIAKENIVKIQNYIEFQQVTEYHTNKW